MVDNKVYIVWDGIYDASIVKIFPSEELRTKWLLQRAGVNYHTSEYELTLSAIPPRYFSGWGEAGREDNKIRIHVSDEEDLSETEEMYVSTDFGLTAYARGSTAEEVEQNILKLMKLWESNSEYFKEDETGTFMYNGPDLNEFKH